MACNFYYDSNATPPNVVDKNWVAYYGNVDPEIATPQQLADAGFYCYTQGAIPAVNPQIYFLQSDIVIDGTNATENYTVVALPLADSKATYVSAINSKAYSILLPSDWLTSRAFEEGTEIPPDWNSWRASIRSEARTKVQAVNDCESAEALETYVSSEAYSYWPPEPTTPA